MAQYSRINSILVSGRTEAWLSRLPWAQEVFYDSNRAVMETQAKA